MSETSVNKVVLKKSFEFEGQTHTEIVLDLDSLTGQDMIDAEAEARASGDRAIMLETSKTYHVIVAAKAGKVPAELLKKLPAKEFTKITALVQSFFFE